MSTHEHDTPAGTAKELAALQAELATVKGRFKEEEAIVDRVWKSLGISTYEQAGGKAIDELVSDLRTQLTAANAQLDSLKSERERLIHNINEVAGSNVRELLREKIKQDMPQEAEIFAEKSTAELLARVPDVLIFIPTASHAIVSAMAVRLEKANTQLEEAKRVLGDARKQIGDFLSVVYGQGLEVAGWHQNGDTQSLDSFIDDNISGDLLNNIDSALSAAAKQEGKA